MTGRPMSEEADEYRRQVLAEVKEDAFEFVVGWLSSRFTKSQPHLAEPTARVPVEDEDERSWVYWRSRGGLRVPTEAFKDQVRQWESAFDLFHDGNMSVNLEPLVIDRFTEQLVGDYPDWDKAVLKKYSVFKLHVRVKKLERVRKDANRERLASNRVRRKARAQYGRDC